MPTMDEAVKLIRDYDDQIEKLESETKSKVDAIKAKRSTIENWIGVKSLQEKVDSYKTKHGTAFFMPTAYCSVADWDAVFSFIRENEAWDMLNHAVNKKSVTAYLDANNQLPPGVNYTTKRVLHIRKPTIKE